MYLQIFYMLYCPWQTTRKLIKSSKNVRGKSTRFCLGPKIGIGHWDPHFMLRSKIHVLGSTILELLLILVRIRIVSKQGWKCYSAWRQWVRLTILTRIGALRLRLMTDNCQPTTDNLWPRLITQYWQLTTENWQLLMNVYWQLLSTTDDWKLMTDK